MTNIFCSIRDTTFSWPVELQLALSIRLDKLRPGDNNEQLCACSLHMYTTCPCNFVQLVHSENTVLLAEYAQFISN